MAEQALTTIRHGEEDGAVTVFEPGDKVTGFDKDALEEMRLNGSVGDPPPDVTKYADENEALKAEVEELKSELSAAKSPVKPGK